MTPHVKMHILYKLDEMEEFKLFTLSAIEDEKKYIKNRSKKAIEGLNGHQKERQLEWDAEEYFMVEDVFKTFSLNSFIIILYSYIEDGLNSLCNALFSDKLRLQKIKGGEQFTITFKDIKGEGINRAKVYLEKVMGVSVHADKKSWSEIDTLRKIRNAIVHDDGTAKETILKDGNIIQHVKNGTLEITDHGELVYGTIVITPKYLDYIIPIVKDFFSAINVKID